MAIDCRCPSCGAVLRIAEKHAGRKVKCPQCAGLVAVPGAKTAKNLPVARPLEPPGGQPPAAAPGATPSRPVKVVEDRDLPGDGPVAGGLPEIVVDPEAGLAAGRLGGPRAGKRGNARIPIWFPPAIVAAVALAVVTSVVLFRQLADRQSILVLDWPAKERSGAGVFIDGQRHDLPPAGPVEYSLQPGLHRVVLLRRGYEQVEVRLSLEAKDRHPYKPIWTPSAVASAKPDRPRTPPGGWLQDMEAAKRQAADEGKDVLIVFEGSDWNEQSIQLRKELFSQQAFREQMEWRFVLVSIDFPRQSEAKLRVEDPQRNQQLAEAYHVSEYPTLVLTDAEGRPYNIAGYVGLGVNLDEFVQRVAFWQGLRERRDAALLEVEKAQGDKRLAAIEKAAVLLRDMRLTPFYEPTINQWLAVVEQDDPDNQKGAYEAVFEASWTAHLAVADEEDPEQIRQVVSELDEWKKKFTFKDPDRAALMHYYAAAALAFAGDDDEASAYIKQAGDYHPKDPALLAMLAAAEAALKGLGSGSGFVVAAGGYILTNHHVIDGAPKSLVRLPDRKEPFPAKVFAQDAERDIALLKIELPDGAELKPLRISAAKVHRGVKIGVFGFPGGDEFGTGLKLTTGVVSAEPDQSELKMYLLDCRVNPGNSGGPLCDALGNVVGMVTRKIAGLGMDSYGMALPGEDLLAFLKEHLPDFDQQQTSETGQTRLEWDEIDRLVGPSVVMILRTQ